MGRPTCFVIVKPPADMELSAENAPLPVSGELGRTAGEVIESGVRIKVMPDLDLQAVG